MFRSVKVSNLDLLTSCRFRRFVNPIVPFLMVLTLINIPANAQQNNIYYYSSGSREDTAAKIIVPQHLGNPANAKQDSVYYSAFRNAKAAKIIVSQSYGDAKKINFPIKEIMSAFLKNAGIKEDTINNDLIIRVRLLGNPLKEAYYRSGTSYSGADIYCSLNIETLKGEIFSDQFKETTDPPSSIGVGQYQSPDNAPFYEVFVRIKTTLLKILYVPFGIEPFLTALTDKKSEFTYDVIDALGKLNDKRAVEPLIRVLAENDYALSRSAVEALGSLNDQRAVEPLIQILTINNDGSYESNSLIKTSIKALGDLRDARAIEPLVLYLRRKEVNVHAIVTTTLL